MNNIFNEIKGVIHGQELIFYSMFKGIKKTLDLWIKDSNFDKLKQICEKYNIYMDCDIKFIDIGDYTGLKDKYIGGRNLNTTKVFGEKIISERSGNIHVFLSMNKDYLEEIIRYSWYPVISDNRVVYKSFQDTQDFGDALGYPYCCREFFFKKNDWNKYSFLYEIYKKSDKYDYRCNCLWKDYKVENSYIYHMPCSFDCKETIKYSTLIEQELLKEFPEILNRCIYYLKLPCLVIREKKIYAFEGGVNLKENEINYSNYYSLGNPKEGDISLYLGKGNKIRIIGWKIYIYYNANLIYVYDCSNQEDIEIPFIINFGVKYV